MSGDGLSLASSLEHEKLWQDGHRLQPDGESPQDIRKVVLVREDEGQCCSSRKEVLDAKGVDVGIVGWLIRIGHEVDDVSLRADE